MKKYLKIFLFLLIFMFLSTFNFSYNNKVTNVKLFESLTAVNYSELAASLAVFNYNLTNSSSFIVDTNKFLCTGENITCEESSTYNKLGLINLEEYNTINGTYINANNSYWTMTEEGTAAYKVTSTGTVLTPKENYAGVRPVVYLQNYLKVTGSGLKSDPYVFSKEIDYYVDATGANYPELASNMIPVKRDGNKWIKADVTKKWYNYANQEWANAVLVKETGTNTREYYLSRPAIGNEVHEEDILAYFVWIPRYAYKIVTCYHSSCDGGAGVISIKFLNGNTNNTVDETEVFEDNASNVHFIKHPAFEFGETELKGIWVAKFETTGTITSACTDESCITASLTSKPNIVSLRDVSISNMFFATRSMERSNNEYGFISSEVDTHMIKSVEWGAISYLTQSSYGKYGNNNYTSVDKEIWINPSNTFITGCAGSTLNAAAVAGCPYDFTTQNGLQTSTTGNIYGIYDINGGVHEYVMGNFNGNLGSSNFSSLPNEKYYDSYSSYSNLKYGDAIWETSINTSGYSSWYTDFSVYVSAGAPWIGMGASYSAVNFGGSFCFYADTGAAALTRTWRMIIINE